MAEWTRLTRSYVPVSLLAGLVVVLPYLVTAVGEVRSDTTETGDGETWAYLLATRLAAGLSLPFAVLTLAEWLSRRGVGRTRAGGLLPVLLTGLGASMLPSLLTLAYASTIPDLSWLDYADAFLRCSVAYCCLLAPVMVLTGLPVRPARPRRGRFSAAHWRGRLTRAGACFLAAVAAGALATQVRYSTEQCVVVRKGLYYDTGCIVWLIPVALGVGVLVGLIAAAAWWYNNSGHPAESPTPQLSVRQDRARPRLRPRRVDPHQPQRRR